MRKTAGKLCILLALLIAVTALPVMPETEAYAAKKTYRTVNHNMPLAADGFMEDVEGYSFKLTKKKQSAEYDKFILKTDPAIYVPEGFADMLSEMIDIIEEITGESFCPDKEKQKKYTIRIIREEDDFEKITQGDKSAEYIYLTESEAAAAVLTDGISSIAEKFLREILLNKCGYLGDIIAYGYEQSYAGTVEKLLMEKGFCKLAENEREKQAQNLIIAEAGYFRDGPAEVRLNELIQSKANAEKFFFTQPSSNGLFSSYWVVEYIRERYGEEKFGELLEVLAKAEEKQLKKNSGKSGLTGVDVRLNRKTEYTAIKKTLSKKFAQDFFKWLKKQNVNTEDDIDFSGISNVSGSFRTLCTAKHALSFRSPGFFAFTDSIEFDYSRALAYIQQVMNKDCKGLAVEIYGKATVEFYDQYGTKLYTVGDGIHYMDETVRVPYAVKLRISAPGKNSAFLSVYTEEELEDDPAFNDIDCSDGPVFKTAIKDRTSGKSVIEEIKEKIAAQENEKEQEINVKSAAELKKAIEKAGDKKTRIIVTDSFSLKEYTVIKDNIELIVRDGRKITLDESCCLRIYGKLTCDKNGINFKIGWIIFEIGAEWSKGDFKITTELCDPDEGTANLRIDGRKDGRLELCYGINNAIRVTIPKNKKASDYLKGVDISDGTELYVNGKKLSQKEIKALE